MARKRKNGPVITYTLTPEELEKYKDIKEQDKIKRVPPGDLVITKKDRTQISKKV